MCLYVQIHRREIREYNLEFVEEGSELLYHANGLDVFSGKAIGFICITQIII